MRKAEQECDKFVARAKEAGIPERPEDLEADKDQSSGYDCDDLDARIVGKRTKEVNR